MSSTHDLARTSTRSCHVSAVLNFVIGGLVLAGLVVTVYFVLLRG
jgi:hypothetical protein